MSKPKRPKRKQNRQPGNITAERAYDPFPKAGLVKQHERFIRKHVHHFCRQYPGLNREHVLCRAVEIAIAAEGAYKPERGSFATYLIWRLKELHRLHDEDEKANSSPVHYAKGELEQDQAEERGEEVELNFSGGYNGARLTFDLQWWLARLCSDFISYIGGLRPFAVDESEIRTFKTEKPRKDSEPPKFEERTNYSQLYKDDLIPALASRHRVAAGVQLRRSDNAPAIRERISADLPEVVRQQPVSEKLKGWIRAIFDHDIRRQREADDEAQKRLAGDHSPIFLEADRNAVDVRFPGARRPPKYLPARIPLVSLDAPMGETQDGGTPRSLHEIVGDDANLADVVVGEGLDKQVDTMRWGLEQARPELSKNAQLVADRMLDTLESHRSRSLTEIAAEIGLSKGYVSKLWDHVAAKVAEKIRGRK